MKSEYKNVIRSKKLMKDALLLLLEKKQNVADISVADIVKVANINRGTFYNHYSNPTEILEQIKDELMSKLSESLRVSASLDSVDLFVDTILAHLKENEKEYKIIISAIPMSTIDGMKREYINQIHSITQKLDTFSVVFIVNGLAGLYIDYLKENIKFSYDEIGKKSKEAIKKFLK